MSTIQFFCILAVVSLAPHTNKKSAHYIAGFYLALAIIGLVANWLK